MKKITIMELHDLMVFVHIICMLIQTIIAIYFSIQRYNKQLQDKINKQMREMRALQVQQAHGRRRNYRPFAA